MKVYKPYLWCSDPDAIKYAYDEHVSGIEIDGVRYDIPEIVYDYIVNLTQYVEELEKYIPDGEVWSEFYDKGDD